ncbi:MAG: hypothetical protein A2745_01370 [Candidatus Harrisonbacteria bacterium RIFCSPHIGHO2_01_FULL_44_13]|uniref:PNPLA domain-containing protein n=1 Tax=Candidatus Harrisonbacteria bacterium RIFCSPLOWO2_01_FULL_44_18 TaxID=1798407 RepID=A0A1G1ZNZ3_9BACT|nr:MAG: hypothetical protein A2745_01370 [Candidatus Harrisonbacteria bacterium RIFCSPHIGHO2_01_FULL_44_13]OGY66149.1 MAG: hypothetical protein A3A16_02465 [Candidatus Harrisonbacteria bacterium RIFCSPLOWO2_01_FULL_44_18]
MKSTFDRTAVIFDSGGFNGVLSIGPAKAIWSRGVKPVALFGTSVGAINAAKIAETNALESVNQLEIIWLLIEKLGPEAIFNSKFISYRLLKGKPALFRNDKLIKLISSLNVRKVVEQPWTLGIVLINDKSENFPADDLLCSDISEFLARRFQVVSSHDKEVEDNPELLKEYILASASVPGAFEAVKIGDRKFSDGFVFSSVSKQISQLNCDTVILILNKNPLSKARMSWHQAMFGGLRYLQDTLNAIGIIHFLQAHQDFSVWHCSKEITPLRVASERRFIIIEPPNAVPDLEQVRFKDVDFSSIIKEGFKRTQSFLSIIEP